MTRICLFISFLLVAMTSNAHAIPVTVTVDMPELIGTYIEGGEARSAEFNLGTQFSSIESASIAITGIGAEGLMERCLVDDPMTCEIVPSSPTLSYQFVSEPDMGDAPFGTIGPYSGLPPQTLIDDLIQPARSIDFLLDGAGTLLLRHESFICLAIFTCTPVVLSQVEVSAETVQLSVTGATIPEPSTVLLFMLGLMAVALSIRKGGIAKLGSEKQVGPA